MTAVKACREKPPDILRPFKEVTEAEFYFRENNGHGPNFIHITRRLLCSW